MVNSTPAVVAAVAVFILALEAVHAAPGIWSVDSQVRMRGTPAGVALRTDIRYRIPFFDSDNPLLQGAQFEMAARIPVSPASIHPAGYVKITPLAPISFQLTAQQLFYFGLFGNLHEFDSLDADWGRDARPKGLTAGQSKSGYRLVAEGSLQVALGPFVTVNRLSHGWVGANIPSGKAWYEPTTDLFFASDDRIYSGESLAGLFVLGDRRAREFLLVGARWEGHWVRRTRVKRQIVGGVTLWRPGWWTARRLTFALVGGFFAQDVNREGEPYAAGLVIFGWDGIGEST